MDVDMRFFQQTNERDENGQLHTWESLSRLLIDLIRDLDPNFEFNPDDNVDIAQAMLKGDLVPRSHID